MKQFELFEELFVKVGKMLLQEGEEFRLKHPELLDVYSRLCELEEVQE